MRTLRRGLVLWLATSAVLALVAGCGSGSSGVTSTSTDGATLVSQVCGKCHPIDRVDGAQKDRAGWTSTVERMMTHGLRIDGAQKAAIVDYLAKRDGGT